MPLGGAQACTPTLTLCRGTVPQRCQWTVEPLYQDDGWPDGMVLWASGARESCDSGPHICPCANTVWARKCRLTCTKALERAPTCCIISRNGKRFLHEEDSCCSALPACRKGRSGRLGCRRPPSVRPVSRARRGDPDRSGVTARAITAPARAGPEVVPRAGRTTLHGRRAALRAGRPRKLCT
jgi:hypothetical protein